MADYVDKNDLHKRLKQWLIANPDGSNMPNDIGRDIMLIAENTMNRYNFISYTQDWKEEMIGKSIINCVKYMKNYKWWEYDNPHAYITMIVFRTSRPIIKKLKRRHEGHMRLLVDKLEEIKIDDRFSDIDPEIMNDLYDKIEKLPLEKPKTVEQDVEEWKNEMAESFDEMDFEFEDEDDYIEDEDDEKQ